MSDESTEMKIYAKTACQLGIMWVNPNGTPSQSFNPNGTVTRAEFGTVLSRTLYGTTYNGGTPYYFNHLNALKEHNILTNTNPTLKELRGYVMLMLMRSDTKVLNTTWFILTPVVPEINYTPAEQYFINTLNKNFQFIFWYHVWASDIGIKYLQYFLKENGYFTETINGKNTNTTITSLFNRQKDQNIVQFSTDVGAWYLGPTTRGILNPLLKNLLNK